jgi:hypothetical protein
MLDEVRALDNTPADELATKDRTQKNAHVTEVNIFRYNDVIILSSIVPNSSVWDRTKPYFVDMLGRWEEV